MITNHFEQLRCEAIERGMRDYERGESRTRNPFNSYATDERSYWFEGYDNARRLKEQDRVNDHE